MKLAVLQENLEKAVTVASRFVAVRGQLPILANILFSAEEGRLRVVGTNLELGVNYWIGAKIEIEGKITAPGRLMTELVASLPKDKVELVVDKEKLWVSCGGYKAELRGIGGAEFPEMPKDGGRVLELTGQEFDQVVSQVAMAAAVDEGRPVLTGVRWKMGKDRLECVATDGYRLSVKTLKIRNEEEKTLIIPARAVVEVGHISKSLEGKEAKVRLGQVKGGGQVVFDLGDVQVVARQLAGEFPAFEKIVPAESKIRLETDVEELLAGVRAAAIFARDNANIVRWKINKNGLVLTANSPQVGENQVEVEAKVEGEEGQIAFNSRYLLEFLGAVGKGEIRFEMTGGLSPGVFKLVGDESLIHIIMPVRVQEAMA